MVPRKIPIEPKPEYEVMFVPQLEAELAREAKMDEIILEAEQTLCLRFEHIPGKRVEKIEGIDNPALYKFRPHVANASRFIFTTEEDRKRRIVLGFWPRKHDYRK